MVTAEQIERAISVTVRVRAWMEKTRQDVNDPGRVSAHRAAMAAVMEPLPRAAEVLAECLVGRTPPVSLNDREIESFRQEGHSVPDWVLQKQSGFTRQWTSVEDRPQVVAWLLAQMPTPDLQQEAAERYRNIGYDV